MEHPAEGAFTKTPVERLGILAFLPDDFRKGNVRFGISGEMRWIEIEKDYRVLGKTLGEVLPILRSDVPPESSAGCEWCRYVKLRIENPHTNH